MLKRARTPLFWILAMGCLLAVTGCGKKSGDTDSKDKAKTGQTDDGMKPADAMKAARPAPAPKLAKVDLTAMLKKAGREATTKIQIMAPEGAKVTESFGDVVVSAGKTFKLVVATSAHDVAKDKKFQLNNKVQKHKGFAVDTPEAIIGKSEAFGRTSFFLTANQKVGKETFGCQSKRGAVSFTEAQAKLMLAACKSIKAAP